MVFMATKSPLDSDSTKRALETDQNHFLSTFLGGDWKMRVSVRTLLFSLVTQKPSDKEASKNLLSRLHGKVLYR
jgi:hypothetical protein